MPSTGAVAFIEHVSGGTAGPLTSIAWEEQAATLPGDNTAVRNLYAMNNNGTGLRKLNDQPADFHSVFMLPDGSKLVFAAHSPDGYSQVYLVNLDSKAFEPVQLTSTPGHKMDPMLSADGTKVVFMYANLDSKTFGVGVINADGSNLYVIPTPPDWYIWHPAISPDGTKIALERWSANHDVHAVFIMNADGSNLTKLSDFGLAGYPAFSADGKKVVFSSMSFSLDVFTINVDGTGMKHVCEGWDPMFVGNSILFVFRPGPDYSIDQIYSTGGGRLTNSTYHDAFEMTI
jgi:Tol biopolymer transport system component